MQRIVAHIEQLLLTHDCVIVPKLGGFVLQSVSASCSEGENVFTPMRKELLFNSTLKHQDGLLAEAYMQKYGVDYCKATEMLEQDVEVLFRRLKETGEVELGAIGTLRSGEEERLVFTAAEDAPLNVEAYGLPTFYLTPLSLLKHEQEELFASAYDPVEKKDAIYIRINKSVLRLTASVAAVIAFVFLISTPIRDVNPSTYTASFIPTEISAGNALEKMDTRVVETEPVPSAVAPAQVATNNEQPAAPESAPVVKKTGKTYYVIIGSFPNEEQSRKFISGLDPSLSPNIGSVAKGTKVRVYADKFDNREDAETYLAALRQTDNYKDAWLFISR